MGFWFPSLYQITNVTLSCDNDDDDIEVGNKSHGNVTSKPVAVCTSDNGPVRKGKGKAIKNRLKWIFFIVLNWLSFYWIFFSFFLRSLDKFACMTKISICYPSLGWVRKFPHFNGIFLWASNACWKIHSRSRRNGHETVRWCLEGLRSINFSS